MKANELNYNSMIFRNQETFDYGHGRIEEHSYRVLPLCYLPHLKHKWPGIQTLIEVKRRRELKDKVQDTTHYYISSLELKDSVLIADAIRRHWRIENNAHWNLDYTFREDHCLSRTDHGPENFSLLRKFVINILRFHQRNSSLESMRLRAAWDANYLNKLIGF